MAIDVKNFKVSADMLKHSAADFKAIQKRHRPDMKVRDINAIYKSIHGFDMSIQDEEKDAVNGESNTTTEELK